MRTHNSRGQVDRDLSKHKGKGAKVEYLKDAISIRVLGFGWKDLKVVWQPSGEKTDDQIVRLTNHLKHVIEVEGMRRIPDEPYIPQLQRKTLPQLGSPTPQVEELDAQAQVGLEAFKAAALAERERREAEGQGDSHELRQPPAPPAVLSIAGKHVEVCYRIYHADEPNSSELFWCSGVVKKVSDGTLPKGGRSKKPWEYGAALIEFDPQPLLDEDEITETWVVLRPTKWNRTMQHGWRYDLDFPDDVPNDAGRT